MSQYIKAPAKALFLSFFYFFVFFVHPVLAWDDETHLAVAKASGYNKWYYVTGPDLTKVKAGKIEVYNHFYDNNKNVEVTPEMVFEQAGRYNDPEDGEGHLYGAILASLREYSSRLKEKDAGYHLAFCAHYIGDLSAPLHNVPYDDFNKLHHAENDGVVGREVLDQTSRIIKNMHPVELRSGHLEEDLAKEIARIADNARLLGYKLKKENRNLSIEEAYIQLGRSASLLKAVLKYFGRANY